VPEGGKPEAQARRSELLRELDAIEREHLRVRAGLAALGPGAPLPGLHLLAGVAGGQVLLPGSRIAEVALRVACDPVPGGPAWLLGSFVWRGRPALAVDLGPRLGGAPAPPLGSVMVILDGEPTVALVVDEVRGLAEDPVMADDSGGGAEPGLFLGACRLEAAAVAVLAPERIEHDVRRLA